MSTKRLHVIVASTRPARVGPQIADWFTEVASSSTGFDVRLVDLAEIGLPFLDEPHSAIDGLPYAHEHTRRWSALTTAGDAFVFVMPEYNRGYNAPLKNALDFLYYEWNYKPVGFVSYGMSSAGLRAADMIKPVVVALKMVPIAEFVHIHVRQAIDSDGVFVPTTGMADAAHELLGELSAMTEALAEIRGKAGR